MAITTSTVADAAVETVVSSIVQETLIQESKVIPTVQNLTSMVGIGMDQLDVPRFTALATEDVVEGTDANILNPTIAVDSLLLNKYKQIYFEITDGANLESKVSLLQQIIKDAAKSHAAQVDNDIITELKLASASAPDHRVAFSAGGILSAADIRNARRLLNVQNVPMSDRFMLIGPDAESSLLAISEFIEVQKYGNTAMALTNGEIGRLFGFTVVMVNSPNLTGNDSVFYHRSAVAFAFQQAAKFEQERIVRGLDIIAASYGHNDALAAVIACVIKLKGDHLSFVWLEARVGV
jgi:N4-gp56 family major capsid protein